MASAGEKVERATQRCDPNDEMRGRPDMPATLLGTELSSGERKHEEGIVGAWCHFIKFFPGTW